MPRSECDENRDQTCSTGLHFCSYEYLPRGYSHNQRVVIVKVNPKDVTAIPTDYNYQKARCCSYEVVGEITGNVEDHYRGKKVVDSDASIDNVDVTVKKKVEEDVLESSELTREDIKNALKGMSFIHSRLGKKFTGYSIWNGVDKYGQRKFSEKTGIPRSTLQGWLAVIQDTLAYG
jgi:hypothetical protein